MPSDERLRSCVNPVKPRIPKVSLVVIPLFAEWAPITAVTKSVVSDIVNGFAQELNRTVNQYKLSSTFVLRFEALGSRPVTPVRTTWVFSIYLIEARFT